MPVIVACVLLAVPLFGQEVRVTVLDAHSRRPLEGVIVTFMTPEGARRAAELSTGLGPVRLSVRVGDSIIVRSERIGFAGQSQGPVYVGPAGADIEFRLAPRAVTLQSVAVREKATCGGVAGGNTAVANVWDEVRKALVATQLATTTRSGMQVWRYTRTLDRSLRVLAESTSFGTASTAAGFQAAEPEDLSKNGFIRDRDGVPYYYAPDATVLVSSAFVRDHCFALVPPDSTGPLTGLRFAPAAGRTVSDIAGVLWVAGGTSELRSLDYSYTRPFPAPFAGEDASGHLSFRSLPDGRWVVSRWFVRIPRIAHLRGQRSAFGQTGARDTVLGFREEGGWISHALDADADESRPKLVGVVFDSVAGRPLAGVRIRLGGGGAEATTDSLGRYSLRSHMAGRYMIQAHHERLSEIGIGPLAQDAVLYPAQTTILDWAIPSPVSVRRRHCGQDPAEGASWALLVRVVDSTRNSRAAERAVVTLGWRSVSMGALISTVGDSVAEQLADSSGFAAFCGASTVRAASVRVHDAARTEVRTIDQLSAGDLRTLRIGLGSGSGTRDRLSGRVLSTMESRARPIADAEILDPVTGRAVRTRADGSFTIELFGGGKNRSLIVRAIGYQPQLVLIANRDTLESTRTVVLQPLAVTLDEVKVTGTSTRGRLRGFEERRAMKNGGQFLDRAALANQEHSQLSDVLRRFAGVRLERHPDGRRFVASARGVVSVYMNRRMGSCYWQIVVDGARVYAPGDPGPLGDSKPPSIDDFSVVELDAVELYPGPASVPPQFSGLGATCGTAVLWLRSAQ